MGKMKAIARKKGDWVDVRVLAKHPMESGLAKDKAGKVIPAHFIETMTAKISGKVVFRGYLGSGTSKNPLVRFYIKANKGDKLELSWVDNKKESSTVSVVIK